MATEYTLRTLKDVFDKVPPDRINDCMDELRKLMAVTSNTVEMIRLAGEGEAGFENKPFPYPFTWPDEIVWKDDGRGELVSNFGVTGQPPMMRLEITKKKSRRRRNKQ